MCDVLSPPYNVPPGTSLRMCVCAVFQSSHLQSRWQRWRLPPARLPLSLPARWLNSCCLHPGDREAAGLPSESAGTKKGGEEEWMNEWNQRDKKRKTQEERERNRSGRKLVNQSKSFNQVARLKALEIKHITRSFDSSPKWITAVLKGWHPKSSNISNFLSYFGL